MVDFKADDEQEVLEREEINMSEITVVMTAYNGEKYIREQIDSILHGSFTDFEIHVCDDGSTDRTREIIADVAMRDSRVTPFFNEKNKGVIRNFLEGAANAESPYIMFSDQDDVWLADKLSKSLQEIKKQEKKWGQDVPLVVFADAKVVDGNLNELAPSFHRAGHLNTKKIDLAHLLMENKLIGCTMIMNRAMAELLKGELPVKDMRMHDWWIGLIGAALGKVVYLPEPLLLYRQHGNNIVGSKSFTGYIKKRLASLKKQKQILKATERQAQAFLSVYGSRLSPQNQTVIKQFATLSQIGFWKRRYVLIKNGFFKTGVIRNIGVLLLI